MCPRGSSVSCIGVRSSSESSWDASSDQSNRPNLLLCPRPVLRRRRLVITVVHGGVRDGKTVRLLHRCQVRCRDTSREIAYTKSPMKIERRMFLTPTPVTVVLFSVVKRGVVDFTVHREGPVRLVDAHQHEFRNVVVGPRVFSVFLNSLHIDTWTGGRQALTWGPNTGTLWIRRSLRRMTRPTVSLVSGNRREPLRGRLPDRLER